jgi:eukaryotic-like serine/threonine-protein kinase
MTQISEPAPVGPGTLIGSVRLKRLLGQGGMGSVWIGDHASLETEVAVKFMSAEIATKPEAVARFKREATAAAQLKSPHVVQVLDHGVTPYGVPFIVMELLEGEDVGKRVGRLGQLPVVEVCAIVTQACKALGKAHARGIVHRDIKPDNIFLVDSEGELFVKLLDFGIAKRAEDAALHMTGTGTMVGTPYFMSPEQVMSAKDADYRADLWSLAVVAYNALTGRVPFFAETLGALCVAIHSGYHAPVTRDRPELPAALDSWFHRALARDPAARFASAKQMAEEFARASGVAIAPTASLGGAGSSAPLGERLTAAITTPGFGTPSPTPLSPAPNTLFGAIVTHPGTPKSHKRLAIVTLLGGALAALAGAVLLLNARIGPAPVDSEPHAVSAPDVQPAPPMSTGAVATTPPPAPSPPARATPELVSSAVSPQPKSARTKPAKGKASAVAAPSAPVPSIPTSTPPRKGKDYGF